MSTHTTERFILRWPSMCSYSSLAEAINSLLVFTQQPLLPPLDIFGCFCDQEAGRRMSDRGRMSIKSSGSPPTLPYSYTLNSSSTNMWTSVDCFVFFTVAWLCSFFLLSVVVLSADFSVLCVISRTKPSHHCCPEGCMQQRLSWQQNYADTADKQQIFRDDSGAE